ncbi:hypothetical protein [Zunongwangia pacifica]|uniref:Uncharacterized protein n=1 Tax=Zunongwangia pacifica TaxID=2911062 RepID=A0A9X2A281_9FLAO|nr:hypothetical protein [Zunongwangia pacifica]MCL6220766.1 hypothetical protein [Zunongwangia pacifica]
MRFTFLFFVIWAFFPVEAQFISTKINGTISHEYATHDSPIKIIYKIHPHGGSGSYTYKWKVQKGGFIEDETNSKFVHMFNCNEKSEPTMMVSCEITDTETNKKIIIKTKHPVEFCLD